MTDAHDTTRPERRRRLPRYPCPHHGVALVHDGEPCRVVGIAGNRHPTWRCGRWLHEDAARRLAGK